MTVPARALVALARKIFSSTQKQQVFLEIDLFSRFFEQALEACAYRTSRSHVLRSLRDRLKLFVMTKAENTNQVTLIIISQDLGF